METYIKNFPNIKNHRDIIVDTLEEALQIAEEYKTNNKFNLFRGQSGLWPLIPTTNRTSEEERNESEKALSRLDAWAKENDISTNYDYIEGIAQHYGMKTLFIDFTTDPKVAAYFASMKSGYEPNEYGCIWCLNTEEFNDRIKEVKKYNKHFKIPEFPRIVDIDIHNLWRLEAQKGKFIYQPIINLEFFFFPNRIIFKNIKNNLNLLEDTYIYPKSKSALEERLDGFFLYEQIIKHKKSLDEFTSKLKNLDNFHLIDGTLLRDIPLFNDSYVKDCVHEDKLLNFQWNEDDIKSWKNNTLERFEDVYTTDSIEFDVNAFDGHNQKLIYNVLLQILDDTKNIRNKAIKFTIKGNIQTEYINKFEQYTNKIWNGMRKLPYSNNDIANTISHTILYADKSRFNIKSFFKDKVEVVVTDRTGGFAHAFISESLIRNAMRDDLKEILKDDIQDIINLLLCIKNAKLLYKFNHLIKLFADSIILTQVVYEKNDFVIFSPLELNWIGIP